MEREFEAGQAYALLLKGQSRKKTLYFSQIADIWGEDEEGNIVVTRQAYEFTQHEGHGNHYWLSDEHIIEAEPKQVKPAKAKAPKTCGRCGGSGVLENMRHVRNGQCFDCGGAGTIRK